MDRRSDPHAPARVRGGLRRHAEALVGELRAGVHDRPGDAGRLMGAAGAAVMRRVDLALCRSLSLPGLER
jgi:hypothetical protein